jgi:hypothetical protein
MPKVRSLDQIKLNLLQPALSSHFEVEITPPSKLSNAYFSANGVQLNSLSQDKLNLLCSETVLPGSSIATLELNNDYHGATVRHAYRRLYDDRIDLTFYVSADDYLPIRYFETWIKYIVGESITGASKDNPNQSMPGSRSPNYFYRVNYPSNYISEPGIKLTKFERTGTLDSYSGRRLEYQFINVFPIAISSMPVSYDSSSLLKCTVSMSYLRYIMLPPSSEDPAREDQYNSSGSSQPLTPEQIALANQRAFDPILFSKDLGVNYENFTTTGGVDYSKAFASGNTVNVGNTYSSNTNLF